MLSVFKSILLAFCVCASLQIQAQVFRQKANAEELYNEAVKETRLGHYDKALTLVNQGLKKQPDDIDMQLLLGRLYMLTGNNEAARKQVKKVLTKAPRYRDAYQYAINIEIITGKYEEADCYTDEALGYFPNDRDFMLKKMEIQHLLNRINKGNQLAENLLSRFSEDTTVRNAYIEHYLFTGRYYMKNGNPQQAGISFEKVLALSPANTEAKDALLRGYIQGQDYESALEQINAALSTNPSSYELLLRKLDILRNKHAYADALIVFQTILRYHPNDAKVRGMETELRMEAAAYYANTDPYLLYRAILEKNPGNQEALNKLIGFSMSRGAYKEALEWINRGLKSNPNNLKLLSQKIDMLEGDRKYTEAALLAERLWQRNPSADLKARLVTLQIASGRYYLSQLQYDEAITAFERVLTLEPNNKEALENIVNTYIARKDVKNALLTLDKAISYYPADDLLLLKKSSILADAGRFEEAAQIAAALSKKSPGDTRFAAAFTAQRLAAGRTLMQAEEYDLAKEQFTQVLEQDPKNEDALNYMINLESGTGQSEQALYYANQALLYNPGNKDLLLKKAGVLDQLKRYPEAADIMQQLIRRYPYTAKYKTAYLSSLLASGNRYQQNNMPDSALSVFTQVLTLNPKDSLALQYTTNILMGTKQYDSALVYVNEGIKYYPDNTTFLMKRATILENQQAFAAASLAADSLVKLNASPVNTDYADYLKSKTLKNQFGLFFLHSSFDYNDDPYSIATIEYRRFMKRGSYAARVNYAGRKEGTGLQAEGELYYTHHPKWYSYAVAAYSNELVFPQLRAGYSIFRSFKYDIEAELGIRYLKAEETSSISGVTSIAKTFDDFWINLRAYFISDDPEFYTSFNLTTRYYMNRRQDYISFVAGLGTSPDDKSRLIQFPKLAGLLTRSIGAGYQHVFKYRTTIGINGTWITQKITSQSYQNQYDLYLTFLRKF
ncbi:tetratricopeptide repeat protein [Chitinophaga defluvii]|uniref:Tetratricopeptide repeat protein n=1 Tax=Chitinophaga defluvii TaxID=3163343 RepID=A0ABV2T4P2_9BACT